jgi:uncharacterized Rmd1/YagE family protein
MFSLALAQSQNISATPSALTKIMNCLTSMPTWLQLKEVGTTHDAIHLTSEQLG